MLHTRYFRVVDSYILAIESSCDDTSTAVLHGREVLSNLVANQDVHMKYGGVVPELASREHQKNILPVVNEAVKRAGIELNQIDAIAYTNGPGLLGSLLVGSSFAKGLSISLDVPLIEVHHMQAHVLAHWIRDDGDGPEANKSSADSEGQVPGPGPNRAKHDPQTDSPNFPFLCLTVSGGHTQIVRVDGPQEFTELGSTLDDAAGEAFDKVSKIMGLPFPGGPVIDKLAKEGNPKAFEFSRANVPFPNYSFSGLKTGVLYFLRKEIEKNPNFIEENKADICASVQRHIVSYLLDVFAQVVEKEGITDLGLAGGVSANSELRSSFISLCESRGWRGFIPKFEYCTDNAAMIGIAGQFLFEEHREGSLGSAPKARLPI